MSICATKLSMQKYGSTAGLVEITSKSMASTFPRACKSKGVHLETIESFSDVNFASLIEAFPVSLSARYPFALTTRLSPSWKFSFI